MVALPAPAPPALPQDLATAEREEILARYLPGVLRQDTFLANFLRVFDDLLQPILATIGSVDSYLDPNLTPAEMVEFLAAWVGEELTPKLPERAKRALVKEAAWLHRARGTREGLRRAFEIVVGEEVQVSENTAGLRLDEDVQLGINSSLEAREPHTIHILLPRSAAGIDIQVVEEILRRFKPAHAICRIHTKET